MPKKSAGILMYRFRNEQLEVFLVHPGGPFWAKKDAGSWSIPKGEYGAGEDALAVARREFREETGFEVQGLFLELGTVRQPGGKLVTAWAVQGECDPAGIRSNCFVLEWPPGTGISKEFPEVDRAEWFTIAVAGEKLLTGQVPLLDRLCDALKWRRWER
ncbi:NUDIX domain-containing protein [Geobacter sp. SVR]|uniref:NUDIX domain-containing protein n=1 Tax=Geobacter sp. SVR TaxID=2495594 RepID=UPI00143F0504|nr:NUDIX domain-containing protein [Geobacter sp. SVR]BCS53886.1 NTP pyrophosphohydrolase [Geobacter sp. SVR]GCF85605.1 NTP pyrophosphohydrolase [Geobacter sp. SVR]